jgi:hypothetical protein
MKNYKACGSDAIDYEMLKHGGGALAEVLYQLFGIIWEIEDVPSIFRQALICPVYKRKRLDRSALASYRPISLTSTVGKCLEAIILDRITVFIEGNNLLSDHQGGFSLNAGVLTSSSSSQSSSSAVVRDLAGARRRTLLI